MSRNSKSINILKESLTNISGLDGCIGFITESLIPIIQTIEKSNRSISHKDIKKFKRACERYNSAK